MPPCDHNRARVAARRGKVQHALEQARKLARKELQKAEAKAKKEMERLETRDSEGERKKEETDRTINETLAELTLLDLAFSPGFEKGLEMEREETAKKANLEKRIAEKHTRDRQTSSLANLLFIQSEEEVGGKAQC